MNKQEAIEQVKNKALHHCGEKECYKDGCEKSIELNTALEIINQINESQKVVVPKFVAEWIEECKCYGWHLEEVLYRLDDDENVGNWAYDENDDLISEKVDIVARAWLDGYEVEKEKLYTVEIPNPQNRDGNLIVLIRNIHNNVVIDKTSDVGWKRFQGNQLTEAEIKEDFEWAWDAGFAKEVV